LWRSRQTLSPSITVSLKGEAVINVHQDLQNWSYCFIGKLEIFLLMCVADKVWIMQLTLIHKNIRSVRNSHAQVYRSIWRKTHYDVTDKNNNISFEGLDIHYHKYPSSPNRTHWDISDNVCLDLQNCYYSIFISNVIMCFTS